VIARNNYHRDPFVDSDDSDTPKIIKKHKLKTFRANSKKSKAPAKDIPDIDVFTFSGGGEINRACPVCPRLPLKGRINESENPRVFKFSHRFFRHLVSHAMETSLKIDKIREVVRMDWNGDKAFVNSLVYKI
jgi:hypothetical protein